MPLKKIGYISIAILVLLVQWFTNTVADIPLIMEVQQLKLLPFLETRYLYWYLLLFTISFPLTFSWYKPINFYKNFKALFTSIFLVALPFIIWDVIFTKLGVWGFNATYFQGFSILGLPLEECLFFVLIPYSCVFIYESHDMFFNKTIFDKLAPWITRLLIPLFFIVGFSCWSHIYTSTTFLLAGFVLSYHYLFVRVDYMGKFYWAFLWSCLPFLIVNGALTGAFTHNPVVIYNPMEYLDIRIISVPLDDLCYSFLLLFLVISFFEYFRD